MKAKSLEYYNLLKQKTRNQIASYPTYRHQKLQFPADFSNSIFGCNCKELIPIGLIELLTVNKFELKFL